MRKLMFVLILGLFFSCNDITTDPSDKNATKVGFEELKTQPGFETLGTSYDNYTPNEDYVDSLRSVFSSSTDQFYIYLKMDCHCNASTKLLPRMLKTLDAAGINHENLNMYIMHDETYDYPEKDFITVSDLPQLFIKSDSIIFDLTSTPDSLLIESALYRSFK